MSDIKPGTLVPRKDVYEVEERTMWDGSIKTKLNENDLSNIAEIINKEDIKAVSICFAFICKSSARNSK